MSIKLPAKEQGVHRFAAMAMFPMSEEECLATSDGTFTKRLSQDNVASIDVGCADCEQPFQVCKGRRCSAAASPEFESLTEQDR